MNGIEFSEFYHSVMLYTAGLTLENELMVRNAIRKEPICSGKEMAVKCVCYAIIACKAI